MHGQKHSGFIDGIFFQRLSANIRFFENKTSQIVPVLAHVCEIGGTIRVSNHAHVRFFAQVPSDTRGSTLIFRKSQAGINLTTPQPFLWRLFAHVSANIAFSYQKIHAFKDESTYLQWKCYVFFRFVRSDSVFSTPLV